MPREKKYESRAEQQRAYRERKEAAQPGISFERKAPIEERREEVKELVVQTALSEVSEQALRDRFGYTASETRTKAERDEVARRMTGRDRQASEGVSSSGTPGGVVAAAPPPRVLSEEAYVAEQMALTRAHVRTLRAPEKTTAQAVEDRLARAEAYARWRYRGFLAGEVFSL